MNHSIQFDVLQLFMNFAKRQNQQMLKKLHKNQHDGHIACKLTVTYYMHDEQKYNALQRDVRYTSSISG